MPCPRRALPPAARKTVLMVGIMAAHALGEGCAVGVSFCGERGWAQVGQAGAGGLQAGGLPGLACLLPAVGNHAQSLTCHHSPFSPHRPPSGRNHHPGHRRAQHPRGLGQGHGAGGAGRERAPRPGLERGHVPAAAAGGGALVHVCGDVYGELGLRAAASVCARWMMDGRRGKAMQQQPQVRRAPRAAAAAAAACRWCCPWRWALRRGA